MIVAIDPGGETGLAGAHYQEGEWKFSAETLGPEPHHLALWRMLGSLYTAYGTDLTIVCESFEYRNKERPGLVLDSVEYIGVVKLFVEEFKVPLQTFSASEAKSFVKDHNLKRMGLYRTGKKYRHERDACRHLLFYMTKKLNNIEILRKGWKE
jgi:hypothetical protein